MNKFSYFFSFLFHPARFWHKIQKEKKSIEKLFK